MSFSQQSGLVEVMEIFQFDAKEKRKKDPPWE